jgi:hypothetical protein
MIFSQSWEVKAMPLRPGDYINSTVLSPVNFDVSIPATPDYPIAGDSDWTPAYYYDTRGTYTNCGITFVAGRYYAFEGVFSQVPSFIPALSLREIGIRGVAGPFTYTSASFDSDSHSQRPIPAFLPIIPDDGGILVNSTTFSGRISEYISVASDSVIIADCPTGEGRVITVRSLLTRTQTDGASQSGWKVGIELAPYLPANVIMRQGNALFIRRGVLRPVDPSLRVQIDSVYPAQRHYHYDAIVVSDKGPGLITDAYNADESSDFGFAIYGYLEFSRSMAYAGKTVSCPEYGEVDYGKLLPVISVHSLAVDITSAVYPVEDPDAPQLAGYFEFPLFTPPRMLLQQDTLEQGLAHISDAVGQLGSATHAVADRVEAATHAVDAVATSITAKGTEDNPMYTRTDGGGGSEVSVPSPLPIVVVENLTGK